MAAHSNRGPDTCSLQLTHSSVPSFIKHPRVHGPLYRHIKIGVGHRLDTMSSGVLVMAVGNGNKLLPEFQKARFTRTYTLHGRLGFATKDFSDSGQVIEKVTYDHVTRERLERVIAMVHSSHQKALLTYSGIGLSSQAAYEMAAQGFLRPTQSSPTLLTALRCVHFRPPDFTLEVHCVNETCPALRRIIHEIGLELRSAASCLLVRRTFEQPFGLDDALLPAQWGLTAILNSIQRGQPAVTRFFARLLSSPQPTSEDICSHSSTGHQNRL
uniref:pseudouridylate synthase TRUB2, mitochondrial-like n=1 Tax=Myxine glutinosa TaxID=7769 RepID=UPI00358F516B